MAFAVKVNIDLVDKITGGLKKVDRQLLKTAKTAQIAGERFKKAGKAMSDMGRNMSLKLTAPIVALGAASVRNFAIQEDALAQVRAGLEATSNAAGFTIKQFEDMAAQLQKTSTFGDDEILRGVTAQLQTFTNITGPEFADAQQAILDVAVKTQQDLKSTSIQLGKALNDPIANLGALSRTGIQFAEDQKEVIKSLFESGRKSEAQAMILKELQRQYGGAAEAASKAGLGPFKQLSNSLGDTSEAFGKIIVDALIPFIEKVNKVARFIDGLSPRTKKFIVAALALTAVLGPLLLILGQMAMGVGALLTVLPLMAGVISGTVIPAIIAMTTALLPILLVVGKFVLIAGAVVVAVVAIIKSWNWLLQTAKKVFTPILGWIDGLLDKLEEFSPVLGMIAKAFRNTIVDGIKNVIKGVQFLSNIVDDLLSKIGFGDASVNVTQNRESPINNINKQDINVENVINNEDGKTKSTETRVNGVTVAAKTINRGSMVPSGVFV
tara:strand:- start:32 stop:1516 length:1485 start_codon:yes stop_codon:yes gene_type:complete